MLVFFVLFIPLNNSARQLLMVSFYSERNRGSGKLNRTAAKWQTRTDQECDSKVFHFLSTSSYPYPRHIHLPTNLEPSPLWGRRDGYQGEATPTAPASCSCVCWSLIEGDEAQPVSQWFGSLRKPAFDPLLQTSPTETRRPDSLTAGGGAACSGLMDDICYRSNSGCYCFSTSSISP